jgi:NDP-sugar pyrophosphorylase family protein
VKAVFLCGGRGKRMFPITEDKFLLDFLEKPLLEHQIKIACEAGLSHFVIIGNPDNIQRIEQITKKIPGIEVQHTLKSSAKLKKHLLPLIFWVIKSRNTSREATSK